MTSFFFSLLPTDLQLDLLHAWLNDDDCGILAALDVACSTSEQPSLRYLMEQLPAFGMDTELSDADQSTWHIVDCLHWLASRNVPVKTLLLFEMYGQREYSVQRLQADLTLPLIETLHWKLYDGWEEISSEDLTAVLQRLPNVTAIYHRSNFMVDVSTTPRLTRLTIIGGPVYVLPFIGLCQQLQELRIAEFPLSIGLADLLRKSCPHLRLLHVNVHCFNIFLELLQTFLSLEELDVWGLTLNQVAEVVKDFRNIRKLTFRGKCGSLRWAADAIIDSLERCPHLEYLSTDGFVCSRKDHRLEIAEIASAEVSVDQVSRIFQIFGSVEIFSLRTMLASHYIASADHFTPWPVRADDWMLKPLLQPYGWSLKRLDVKWCFIQACALTCIATAFPQLVSLSLQLVHHNSCSDEEDFCVFLTGCTELIELTLKVSYAKNNNALLVLRAIIHCKLRLKFLNLGWFDKPDAAWFRGQLVEQQLLPIPAINRRVTV